MTASAFKLVTAGCGLILSSHLGPIQASEIKQANDPYYTAAESLLEQKLAQKPITTPAKNIILFVGDGMGISTVTATRILDGQLKGNSGEENILSWEEFPHTALAKTYNINRQIPDSAGTASTFLSGAKTKAGVISVNQATIKGNCKSSLGNHMDSILELSEKAGINTGIITTARLTHATPAASYAHSASRYWEVADDIPEDQRQFGCKDIARQFVDFSAGNGIEVAFGGGRRNFLPDTVRDKEGKRGKRKDGLNLIDIWQKRHKNGQYIWNSKGLEQLDMDGNGPVLGLFNANHMQYEADRDTDRDGEPSLADMTRKALKILQKKDGGYFLYIEGARIDHAHHKGNAYRALHDGIAMADAVQLAREMTNARDTLIIVTADHSHGFVMTGDTTRGNPIMGKVVENDHNGIARNQPAIAEDGSPYTTLGYYNGAGDVGKPRGDLSHVDTTAKDYRQQVAVPTIYERHGGEDVAIYARGPGAYLLKGVVEQNYIFHVMYHAFRLEEKLK